MINDFEVDFPDHIAGIDVRLLKDFKAIVEMCIQNNINLYYLQPLKI
jgi:hypothetical protein